jgi:hypothetical protein
MCYRTVPVVLAFVAVGWSLALPRVGAQERARATVTGVGQVVVTRAPTEVVMQVDLLAEGEDLAGALAKLNQRRADAQQKLAELEAGAESIQWGHPTTSTGQNTQRQQLMRQVRQMQQMRQLAPGIGRPGAGAPNVELPERMTVALPLTVRWTLEEEDSMALLEKVETLREKVTATDLSGAEASEPLPAELQELMEEYGDMMSYYEDDEQQPGKPSFAFAATMSREGRREALAKAFEKARAHADELAAAAGMQLGQLVDIEQRQAESIADPYSAYYPSSYGRYGTRRPFPPSEADDQRTFAETPDELRFTFTIHAQFALDPR